MEPISEGGRFVFFVFYALYSVLPVRLGTSQYPEQIGKAENRSRRTMSRMTPDSCNVFGGLPLSFSFLPFPLFLSLSLNFTPFYPVCLSVCMYMYVCLSVLITNTIIITPPWSSSSSLSSPSSSSSPAVVVAIFSCAFSGALHRILHISSSWQNSF